MMRRVGCLLAFSYTVLATSPALAEDPPKRASEKVSERMSRGAVNEVLDTLDDQENRKRLGRILRSPQMRGAMHDLAAAIVMGVFDGVRKGIKTGPADEQPIPAAGSLTYHVVDSAMSAALAEKHHPHIYELGEGATRSVIRGVASGVEHDLGPALAVTIDQHVGPAIALTLSRDILPAVGRGLDTPEMQSAIASLTRSVATEIIGGAGDAMDASKVKHDEAGTESGLALFGDRVAAGYAIAMFVAFAFGTLLVVVTTVLVRTSRRQRRQAEATKRREAALLGLIDSIEAEHPELTGEMRQLLRE